MKLNKKKVYEFLLPKNISRTFQHFKKIDNIYRLNEKKKNDITLCKRIMIKISKMNNFIIAVALIIFSYYFYVYMNLIVRLESNQVGFTFKFWLKSNWNDINYQNAFINFCVFHFLFIMFFICLLRTIFTNPGELDKDFTDIYSLVTFTKIIFLYLLEDKNVNSNKTDIQWLLSQQSRIEHISLLYENEVKSNFNKNTISTKLTQFEKMIENNNLNVSKRINHFLNLPFYDMNFDNHRFCGFCLFKKPDRTHHCRHCRKCIRKLDHHCHILATCIGELNYKFFIQTLFYCTCTLLYMLFTSFSSLSFYISEFPNTFSFFFYVLYIILLCAFSIIITTFSFGHLIFLIYNMSTIEFKEKSTNESENFFDNNYLKNICDVMGNNVLLWFIPIHLGNIDYKGYEYRLNEEKYEEYKKRKKDELKRREMKENLLRGNSMFNTSVTIDVKE